MWAWQICTFIFVNKHFFRCKKLQSNKRSTVLYVCQWVVKTGNQSIINVNFQSVRWWLRCLGPSLYLGLITCDFKNIYCSWWWWWGWWWVSVLCVPPAFMLVLSEHVKVRGQCPEVGSFTTRALGINHDIRLLAAPLSHIAGPIATPIS